MGLKPSLSARRAWIEIECPLQDKENCWSLSARRAWIEILFSSRCLIVAASLSARRAWIEILFAPGARDQNAVALRKESVDRNLVFLLRAAPFPASLSARRAWIEIFITQIKTVTGCVSLSARRAWIEIVRLVNGGAPSSCRSPQGERG